MTGKPEGIPADPIRAITSGWPTIRELRIEASAVSWFPPDSRLRNRPLTRSRRGEPWRITAPLLRPSLGSCSRGDEDVFDDGAFWVRAGAPPGRRGLQP